MTTLTGLPNVFSDFLYGPGDYDQEDHAMRTQEVYRLLAGLPDWGRPVALTQYDGTGWANELSSTDTVNGRAGRIYSQNTTYEINVSNSGMNIIGAPTMNAFTQGSVLFVGASKVLSEENTKLFWDATNDRLGVGNGAPAQTLHVTGNGQISTFLGVGGAPDTAVELKVTGEGWFTTRLGVGVTPDATIALLVNGTAQATRLGLGVAPDATAVLNASGNVIITGNIVNDTTTFVTDATNNKVGILVVPASTSATLESAGTVMITNSTGTSTTSTGLELRFASGTTSEIRSIDRSTTTFKNLDIYALAGTLRSGGTKRFEWDGTGIGFFTATPVAKQTVDAAVSGTADGTYSGTEQNMLNDLKSAVNSIRTALINYGLAV